MKSHGVHLIYYVHFYYGRLIIIIIIIIITMTMFMVLSYRASFCRAVPCISVAYAVMRCLSVRPSVCHVRGFCLNIVNFFHHWEPHHSSFCFSVPNGMAIFRR